MGPDPIIDIHIREKFGHRYTEGSQPCEDGGRNGNYAATDQRTVKTASNHQQLEESTPSYLESLEEHSLAGTTT